MMKTAWETLLSIGSEGGVLELKGRLTEDGWYFRRVVSDMEEGSRRFSAEGSDEDGLALLDDYAWLSLYPLYVDNKITTAVRKRVLFHRYRNESAFSAWIESTFPEDDWEAAKLVNWILTSGSTVVLTGAGMSTESSLPDFRSKEGWWKNIDPRTVASTEALSHHYDLFHSFYKARLDNLDQASPHNGHRALANWEKYGRIDAVATQNVDGLHQAAGSQTVYELHGSIRRFRCHQCGEELPRSTFIEKEACSCGGRIRPGVVLFGEMLPAEAWEPAMEKMERSDLSIVIGTSLEVYPANQLPAVTRGRTAYINKDIQTGAGDFDLVIRGNAGEVLTTMNTYMDEVLME